MIKVTAATTVRETHDRLTGIGVASKLAVKPPAILLEADAAEVLTELAAYAVRRGFTARFARAEIRSRQPHPFNGAGSASGLTCTECGRSEIFSNHTKEKS